MRITSLARYLIMYNQNLNLNNMNFQEEQIIKLMQECDAKQLYARRQRLMDEDSDRMFEAIQRLNLKKESEQSDSFAEATILVLYILIMAEVLIGANVFFNLIKNI